MLCEKCKEKQATVHITQIIRSSIGEEPGTEVIHHFCEVCGREVMQNTADVKGALFSKPTSGIELHRVPSPSPLPSEPEVDTSKRYDVYCIEPDRQVVAYRNALFKGSATLLPAPAGRIHYPAYVELHQANGQSIFISRSSIFKFCQPGTTLVGEVIDPKKPDVP